MTKIAAETARACMGDLRSSEKERQNRAFESLSAITRFQGGERGCAGQQFENATSGSCYYLPAEVAFLCSTKMCA